MNRLIRMSLCAGMALVLCSACRDDTDALAAAQAAWAQGDKSGARIHLLNALQRDPQSAPARQLLGTLLLEGGNAAAAVIELDKARSLGHPAEQNTPALARALLAQRDYRRVAGLGSETVGLTDAAMADLLTSVAGAQFALRNATAGEVALKEALRLVPGHVPARVLRARRLALAGDIDAALEYARDTVQANPGDATAWMSRAELLAGVPGTTAQAVAAYRKVIELQGDAVAAHSGVLTLLLADRQVEAARQQIAALRQAFPQHPATLYFGAQLALLDGDTAAARAGVEKLLAAAPTDAAYNRLAASVSLQTGELAKAVMQLTGALQANPGDRLLRRMLALALVRSGEGRQALATLQPLLQDRKPDAQAQALAAVASLQGGDQRQAQALFAAASRLAPADPHVQATLAMGRLASGEGAAALAQLQALAQADSGSALDAVVISAYIQRKDFDRGLRAIEALEKKLPRDPATPMLRGDLQLGRGDRAAARASYERAAALAPGYFPAVGALARLDLDEGRPEQARLRFQDLLARDRRNTDALVALAKLNRMNGAPAQETTQLLADAVEADPLQPGTRLLQIEHELSQGNGRAAMVAAEAAVRAMPDDTRLLAAQAQACLAARVYDQAVSLFGKLAIARPDAPEPLQQLARAQLALQRPDQARQALQQALKIAPTAPEVLADLARLEISTGRPAQARQLAQRLRQQRPASGLGLLLEGEAAASARDWAAAEAAYTAALARGDSRARGATGLHALLLNTGKAASAETFASRWLREQPRDADFIQHLADRALLAQDYGRAEALYRSVLRLRPDHPATLNNLAWAASRLGRPEALDLAERAARLRPMEPAFLDTVAQLLAQAGRLDQAVQREARAVELAPENPGLRLALARLYLRAGDKDRARIELDRVAAFGARFAGQAQVEEMRQQL